MKKRLRAVPALTLLTAIVLVALALTVVKSPAQREQIEASDKVAARFTVTLERFTSSTARNVVARSLATKKDCQELLTYLETRMAKAPTLPTTGTTRYGRAESGDYARAAVRRDLALKPFRALSAHLKDKTVPYFAFADAGVKLVSLSPSKLLEDQLIFTGEPLRELVLPAFEKARDKLKKQATPTGSELLRRDLLTYADDVIDQTKGGANDIDVGKPFRFDFGDRPKGLYKRLVALQASILVEASSQVGELAPLG